MAKLHEGLTPQPNPAGGGALLLDLHLPDFADATPLSTPLPSDDEDDEAPASAEGGGAAPEAAGDVFEIPAKVVARGGGQRGRSGSGGGSAGKKRRRSGDGVGGGTMAPPPLAMASPSAAMATSARRERARLRRNAAEAHILSPLETASAAQIAQHLVRLRAGVIFRYLMPLLQRFLNHSLNRGLFNDPVSRRDYPDYCRVIARPMDLGQVKQKLQALLYEDELEFSEEVRTVFQNAMRYNPDSNQVHQNAARLLQEFDADFNRVLQKAKARLGAQRSHGHDCDLCRGNECPLCGEKCLKFDPPMLPCSGTCALNIRRGAVYYMTQDGCRFWCQRCFNALPQAVPPHLVTKGANQNQAVPQPKRELRRLTHSAEDTGEPWVQCDFCRLWMHQACAMFSLRKNLLAADPMAIKWKCAICRLAELTAAADVDRQKQQQQQQQQQQGAAESSSSSSLLAEEVSTAAAADAQTSAFATAPTPRARKLGVAAVDLSNIAHPWPRDCRAETLPKTRMGAFLEERVHAKLRSMDHHSVCASITVRVVCAHDQAVAVHPLVREHFTSRDGQVFPTEMKYRSKAICLFQKLDGFDVCLFSMFVQEYGDECAPPSRRCVYIAYIDSVSYFRPRVARTAVYHELVSAYFEYVRRRGFNTANIWSAPPQRGNTYIFWCHPPHQRTPGRERLCAWYHDLLEQALQDRKIIRVTKL